MWRDTVARIPTFFGRLAYLAALHENGGYRHPLISRALGAEAADRTLRRSHYQVFAEWLALNLEEQRSDLEAFLNAFQGPPDALPYREFAPPGIRDAERQLYLSDLEILLELLKLGDGVGGTARES